MNGEKVPSRRRTRDCPSSSLSGSLACCICGHYAHTERYPVHDKAECHSKTVLAFNSVVVLVEPVVVSIIPELGRYRVRVWNG